MNRKQSKRKKSPSDQQQRKPREGARLSESDDAPATFESKAARLPSQAIRTALSMWVVIHLLALLISFTNVVEPSTIHSRLSESVHPYLRPAHFSADDRPVYLAFGDPDEQPHLLQVSRQPLMDLADADSSEWTTIASTQRVAGLAASDRISRWLSTAAMLSENDQPSLVAELLLPMVERDSSIKAVRIVRLPTDLSDVNAEAETPYVASVIGGQDSVSLLQLNPARLSSQAVGESPRNE